MGLVGYGVCRFSAEFEFQNHPNVEVVAVSDLFPDRLAALAELVKCSKTYPSLEEMVKDDRIEAIFVATDAPSHAKHCVEVLNHGKHVCTAVPAFRGDIDDAERLLECVKKNRGLVYAMFETSVFHDDLYAMEKLYSANVFGNIVYCEGEYCHPHTIGATPLGSYKEWRRHGAPMWYPTHATAYYVGVRHDSLVEVSCLGTAPFDESRRKPNRIGNIFNSEVGLFRTSKGGLCRMIVCGSQGEYLEAGRLRGEYAAKAGIAHAGCKHRAHPRKRFHVLLAQYLFVREHCSSDRRSPMSARTVRSHRASAYQRAPVRAARPSWTQCHTVV